MNKINTDYDKDYFNTSSEKDLSIFKKYLKFIEDSGIKLESTAVCDIGCGTGNFISLLKEGNNCFGYDISEYAIITCKERFSETSSNFSVLDLNHESPKTDKKFNIITMFDIIEHLDNFLYLQSIIDTNLKSGGTVVITTPNANSLLRFILGNGNYTGEKDETHKILFTPYTLDFFLRRAGLKRRVLFTPYSFSFGNNMFTRNVLMGGQIFSIYEKS